MHAEAVRSVSASLPKENTDAALMELQLQRSSLQAIQVRFLHFLAFRGFHQALAKEVKAADIGERC